MKTMDTKKVFVGFYAKENELKMLKTIMEKENRNTVSDCLRTLVKDRFLFLNKNIADAIFIPTSNNQ